MAVTRTCRARSLHSTSHEESSRQMSNRHFSCQFFVWACFTFGSAKVGVTLEKTINFKKSDWRIESSWIRWAARPVLVFFQEIWGPLKLVQATPCQFQEMNKCGRLCQGMSMQSGKADLLKISVTIAKTLHGGQCRVVSDDLRTHLKWWTDLQQLASFFADGWKISHTFILTFVIFLCLSVCAFLSFLDVILLIMFAKKPSIGTMNICQVASSSMAMDFTSSKSCSASSPTPRPRVILSVI